MPYLAILKNSYKKVLDLNPKTDDFQNLISSVLSKGTSPVKFSWRSDR